jgi:hypothetical protein
MASNTRVDVHNQNISLISVPTWNEVSDKAGTYPKGILYICGMSLCATVAANTLRDYVNKLKEEDESATGVKGALARNKSMINLATYPFAEHPVKTTLIIAGLYIYFFKM